MTARRAALIVAVTAAAAATVAVAGWVLYLLSEPEPPHDLAADQWPDWEPVWRMP